MDNYPKISVIIPTFNRTNFLTEAIDSLMNQNYPALEVILVDGGSDKICLDKIKEKEDLFNIFISEKDFGMWHALNKGILEATGDFIFLLNSDDLIEDNAFLTVGKFLKDNEDIDLLYGDASRIDENGNLIGCHKTQEFNLKDLLIKSNYIPTQSCFIRRKCFAYVGLFDTSLIWNGDWDMWKRIALTKKFRIAHIDCILGKWRLYKNTLSYGGGSKEYYHKYLETLKNTRKYSDYIITVLEIKLLPHIIIGLLGLKEFLSSIKKR